MAIVFFDRLQIFTADLGLASDLRQLKTTVQSRTAECCTYLHKKLRFSGSPVIIQQSVPVQSAKSAGDGTVGAGADGTIAVIVVNWNRCELLYNCLRSLSQQRLDHRFEVVLVDNGSHDGSVEMARREFSQL